MWPEKGYAPHKNVGNKHRKDPKEQKKAQKKAQKKEQKERKKRVSEEKRRKSDRDDDEPEWIADFSSKRKGGPKPADSVPLSTAIPTTEAGGRPRKVSFEDEHPPNISGQQRNGNIANGYVPYDYIYGKGSVKTGGVTGDLYTDPTPRPGSNGRHNGSAKSPESSGKHSASSKGRSKHATVRSASNTISPTPVTDGLVSPGSRAFHGF